MQAIELLLKKTPIPIEEVTQQNVTKPKIKKISKFRVLHSAGKLSKDQKKMYIPFNSSKTIVHLDLYYLAKLNTIITKILVNHTY